MPLVKKINLKKYFFLTFFSTAFFLLIGDKSLTFVLIVLFFYAMALISQLMLMGALEEMLYMPPYARRMDREARFFSLNRKEKRRERFACRGSVYRKQKAQRKNQEKRWQKASREKRYQKNGEVRRKNGKIVFLVIGKLLILVSAIGLSVHFIGDKIILPVINYVFQIIALALSVKRKSIK